MPDSNPLNRGGSDNPSTDKGNVARDPPGSESQPPNEHAPADQKRLQLVNDLLIQQLESHGDKVAESFDRLYKHELNQINRLFRDVYSVCRKGAQEADAKGDGCRKVCGVLGLNSAQTAAAALELLRRGYTLQPYILLRPAFEAVASILHLCQEENGLQKFQCGKLALKDTIRTAKTRFPDFGRWYGFLSKRFAHINISYEVPHPIRTYVDRDRMLSETVRSIGICLWLIYYVAELPFIHLVAQPRYWRPAQDGKYYPEESADGRALKEEITALVS